VATRTKFTGHTQPWYRRAGQTSRPAGNGHISCFLRDGDRVFLTYSTTDHGTETASRSFALPGMTPAAAQISQILSSSMVISRQAGVPSRS